MTHEETYTALANRLTQVVEAGTDDNWTNSSPCEGWTAADVLEHIIETQRDFLDTHGIGLDDGRERPETPAGQWKEHKTRVAAKLHEPGVSEATYDGYFGPTTVGGTMEGVYGFDMIVHRWDIARSLGVETRFSAEECETLEESIAGFGDALYSEGICKPPVEVAPNASRQDRLLATLGRIPS